MFDITRKVPSLFAAGDTIRFVPVTQDRFDALKHDLATGAIEPYSFLEEK
jgi:allophanate hydrolase subunit 1